jgi:hypothetical protein
MGTFTRELRLPMLHWQGGVGAAWGEGWTQKRSLFLRQRVVRTSHLWPGIQRGLTALAHLDYSCLSWRKILWTELLELLHSTRRVVYSPCGLWVNFKQSITKERALQVSAVS